MVPQPTCSPARQCWLRAWERAKAEQLIPYHNADGTWMVKTYTITVTGAGWSDLRCSCPAGHKGLTCKHLAVVAKAIAVGVLPVRGTEHMPRGISPAPAFTLQPSTFVPVPSRLDECFA